MSEIGEIYAGLRELGKQKRADNQVSSTQLLTERGISFESKNNGVHLIVRHKGMTFDFWPSTGKYNKRGTTKYRRGVFNLLRDMGA